MNSIFSNFKDYRMRALSVGKAILLLLAFFTLARLTLLKLYGADFSQLSQADLAEAFLKGVRFDLSAICRYMMLPFLMWLVPLPFTSKPSWRKAASLLGFGIASLLLILLAVDVGYFPYIHRHLGLEIIVAPEDLPAVLTTAIEDYWHAILLLILGLAAGYQGWTRLIMPWRSGEEPGRLLPRTVAFVLMVTILYFAAKSQVPGVRRLRVIDAFDGNTPEKATLTLNGPFVLWSLVESSGVKQAKFMDQGKAFALARETLFTPLDAPLGDDYPIARKTTAPLSEKKPNVVVLMLEGWSADALDSLRAARNLPPFGVSPAFDALAKKGRLYTNCYAIGQRTNHGLTATITGMIGTPHVPPLGSGLEARNISSLTLMAKENGYATRTIYATQEVARIAPKLGIDFPDNLPLEKVPGALTPTNSRVLAYLSKTIREAQKPFLTIALTGDTHAPYPELKASSPRPSGDPDRDRFLNILKDCDTELGRFFEEVLDTPQGRDTIFFVVADHIQRHFADGRVKAPELFWIPLLVLGPGIEPGTDARTVCQTDIVATITDLMGWQSVHATVGTSVFAEKRPEGAGAMAWYGPTVLRVEDKGWVLHDLNKRVDGEELKPGAMNEIEERLKALVQTYEYAVTRDRLVPPRKP